MKSLREYFKYFGHFLLFLGSFLRYRIDCGVNATTYVANCSGNTAIHRTDLRAFPFITAESGDIMSPTWSAHVDCTNLQEAQVVDTICFGIFVKASNSSRLAFSL